MHDKTNKITFAPSEVSDQPGHLHSTVGLKHRRYLVLWPHIRSAILDYAISGRPWWMTSHPVGHFVWPISAHHLGRRNIRSAILEWWHSAWLLRNAVALLFFNPYCLSMAWTFALQYLPCPLEKWRENLGSPLSSSLCKAFEELMRSHWGVTEESLRRHE